ncbi:MAG: AEC family transporter, partial [Lachnospiraceae bacterium]|nr:AEC family transporter [Lachnospiraceae bacterium]
KRAFVNILKNPIIIGIFLGLIASYFNLDFPKMVDKTINNLAVMTSPLALISIGAAFEGKKALAKIKSTAVASSIKLIVLAAIFIPIAVYFGFRDQKLIALVIMLASPCTPTAYIMAKNMDGDDVLASSIIVTTTFFSSITLTFWIFILRAFGLL